MPFTSQQVADNYQLPLKKVEEMSAQYMAAGYLFTGETGSGFFLTQKGSEALYVINKWIIFGN